MFAFCVVDPEPLLVFCVVVSEPLLVFCVVVSEPLFAFCVVVSPPLFVFCVVVVVVVVEVFSVLAPSLPFVVVVVLSSVGVALAFVSEFCVVVVVVLVDVVSLDDELPLVLVGTTTTVVSPEPPFVCVVWPLSVEVVTTVVVVELLLVLPLLPPTLVSDVVSCVSLFTDGFSTVVDVVVVLVSIGV